MLKFCPNCGADLSGQPGASFCEACGAPIPQDDEPEMNAENVQVEENVQDVPYTEPVMEAPAEEAPQQDYQVEETSVPPVMDAPPVMDVPPVMPQPPKGKKSGGKAKVLVPIIILGVLVVALAVFFVLAALDIHDKNVEIEDLNGQCTSSAAALKAEKTKVQEAEDEAESLRGDADYMQSQLDEMSSEVDDLYTQIDDLEWDNEDKSEIIDDLTAQLEEQGEGYAENTYKIEEYDNLLNIAGEAGFGWASENFHTNGSTFVMHAGDDERPFELTCTIPADSYTVHWDESNTDVADVVCYEDGLGETTTPFFVVPEGPGITTVTFSNDINDEIFNILVIVLE